MKEDQSAEAAKAAKRDNFKQWKDLEEYFRSINRKPIILLEDKKMSLQRAKNVPCAAKSAPQKTVPAFPRLTANSISAQNLEGISKQLKENGRSRSESIGILRSKEKPKEESETTKVPMLKRRRTDQTRESREAAFLNAQFDRITNFSLPSEQGMSWKQNLATEARQQSRPSNDRPETLQAETTVETDAMPRIQKKSKVESERQTPPTTTTTTPSETVITPQQEEGQLQSATSSEQDKSENDTLEMPADPIPSTYQKTKFPWMLNILRNKPTVPISVFTYTYIPNVDEKYTLLKNWVGIPAGQTYPEVNDIFDWILECSDFEEDTLEKLIQKDMNKALHPFIQALRKDFQNAVQSYNAVQLKAHKFGSWKEQGIAKLRRLGEEYLNFFQSMCRNEETGELMNQVRALNEKSIVACQQKRIDDAMFGFPGIIERHAESNLTKIQTLIKDRATGPQILAKLISFVEAAIYIGIWKSTTQKRKREETQPQDTIHKASKKEKSQIIDHISLESDPGEPEPKRLKTSALVKRGMDEINPNSDCELVSQQETDSEEEDEDEDSLLNIYDEKELLKGLKREMTKIKKATVKKQPQKKSKQREFIKNCAKLLQEKSESEDECESSKIVNPMQERNPRTEP